MLFCIILYFVFAFFVITMTNSKTFNNNQGLRKTQLHAIDPHSEYGKLNSTTPLTHRLLEKIILIFKTINLLYYVLVKTQPQLRYLQSKAVPSNSNT